MKKFKIVLILSSVFLLTSLAPNLDGLQTLISKTWYVQTIKAKNTEMPVPLPTSYKFNADGSVIITQSNVPVTAIYTIVDASTDSTSKTQILLEGLDDHEGESLLIDVDYLSATNFNFSMPCVDYEMTYKVETLCIGR